MSKIKIMHKSLPDLILLQLLSLFLTRFIKKERQNRSEANISILNESKALMLTRFVFVTISILSILLFH